MRDETQQVRCERRVRRWALIAASIAAAACGSSSGKSDGGGTDAGDPRCSVQNCTTLVGCHYQLQGMPGNGSSCEAALYDADGGSIGVAPYISYCEEACNADGAGAELACFVAEFSAACADAGTVNATDVELLCPTSSGSADGGAPDGGSCTQCQSAQQACDQTCSTSSAAQCLSCGYECAQHSLACLQSCH